MTPLWSAQSPHTYRPWYDQTQIDTMVDAFKALPKAPADAKSDDNTWFVSLQFPTSYFHTRNKNEVEVAIWRKNMLRPATFPCYRDKLEEQVNHSTYLTSIVLGAFSTEANREQLLRLDMNPFTMDLHVVSRKGESRAAYRARRDAVRKEAAEASMPPGVLPHPAYELLKEKVWRDGERAPGVIYRPAQIDVRDIRLLMILRLQTKMFGLPVQVGLCPDRGVTHFAAQDGKSDRKDLTFCCYAACESLSTSHKRCGRCQAAFYCRSEHQVLDWSSHKHICHKHEEE